MHVRSEFQRDVQLIYWWFSKFSLKTIFRQSMIIYQCLSVLAKICIAYAQ